MFPEGNFTHEQIKHISAKTKVIKSVYLRLIDMITASMRLIDDFNKLIQERRDVCCVAVTHSYENSGCKIKPPKGGLSKSTNMNGHKFLLIICVN